MLIDDLSVHAVFEVAVERDERLRRVRADDAHGLASRRRRGHGEAFTCEHVDQRLPGHRAVVYDQQMWGRRKDAPMSSQTLRIGRGLAYREKHLMSSPLDALFSPFAINGLTLSLTSGIL